MNWRTIFTIARKDIKEATQNRAVWLPLLIVPLIFVVIMPLGIILWISTAEVQKRTPERPRFCFVHRTNAGIPF